MTQHVEEDEFFVGWSNSLGRRLRRFLCLAAAIFIVGLGLLGFGLSTHTDDPASVLLRLGERDSAGRPIQPEDWGSEQILRGHLTHVGYPLLHLGPDAAYPRGRTLLLSGDGKRGADVPATAGPVELRGGVLRRGSIEMLVVNGKALPLQGEQPGINPATREPLGRWRIVGEICDGKCYSGAMRPGSGLAHKACANLCLIGEIPPVLVTLAPVAGSFYLALANADGGQLPAQLRDFVAIPVALEGEVERVGNMLVLRLDMASVKRL